MRSAAGDNPINRLLNRLLPNEPPHTASGPGGQADARAATLHHHADVLTEKVAARAHLRRRPKKIGQKLEDQLVLVTPWSLLPVRPKPELRESHRYLVNGPNPDSALNRCASSGIMEGRPPHRCAQITHQHGVRVREASRSASCAGARGAADRTGHEELERAEPGARQHRRAWAQSRSRLWSRWGDSGGAKARMRGQRRLT